MYSKIKIRCRLKVAIGDENAINVLMWRGGYSILMIANVKGDPADWPNMLRELTFVPEEVLFNFLANSGKHSCLGNCD